MQGGLTARGCVIRQQEPLWLVVQRLDQMGVFRRISFYSSIWKDFPEDAEIKLARHVVLPTFSEIPDVSGNRSAMHEALEIAPSVVHSFVHNAAPPPH